MKCSHCGKKNKDGAITCSNCGAALLAPPPIVNTADAARTSSAEASSAESGSYSLEEYKKAMQRRKRRIICWLLLTLALLAGLCYLIFFAGNREGIYLPGSKSYTLLENGGDISVLYNGRAVIPEADIAEAERSIDARAVGVLEKDGRLLLCRRGASRLVDVEITDFIISENGGCLVYRDRAGKLFAFNCKKKDGMPAAVCSEAVAGNYAVSGEGKFIIYNKVSDGALYLYTVSSGKENRLASGLTPIALTDTAKTIYAYKDEECALYLLNRKGSATCLRGGIGGEIWLNCDHSQIVFTSEAANGNIKTFVYSGGREYEAASFPLAPVMTASMLPHEREADGFTLITCPVRSFDGRLFYGEELVRFAFEGSESVGGFPVDTALLSDNSKVLYYVSDGGLYRCGTEDISSTRKIADDCAGFVIAHNGSAAWSLDSEGRLSFEGEGESVGVAENVTSMAASSNGRRLLYVADGRAYYCRSAAPAKPKDLGLEAGAAAMDEHGMYLFTADKWMGVTQKGKLFELTDEE